MPSGLQRQLEKLSLKQPERNIVSLTLYSAGSKVPNYTKGAEKQQIEADFSKIGPKPVKIEKYNKVVKKIKKDRVRGGMKAKIEKNVKQLKEIVSNCKTEEEKNRFNLLLLKAKNNLNRLRKNKPIKNC